jgi:hypothetical protein
MIVRRHAQADVSNRVRHEVRVTGLSTWQGVDDFE